MKFFLQTFYKNGFWYKMMNFQILSNPITETDLVHFAKQMAILKVIFFLFTYILYLTTTTSHNEMFHIFLSVS